MNGNKARISLLVIALGCWVGGSSAYATFVHQFSAGDVFSGNVVGAVDGPFTDPASGVSGFITTTALAPAGAISLTTLGTAGTNGRLGINGPGGLPEQSTSFDDGEGWTLTWSQLSQFVGISFKQYTHIDENFAFGVQSPAWVGLSITPGSADVAFNSGTGKFTFSSQRATTGSFTEIIYTATDLYGVGAAPVVLPNTSYTFSYSHGLGIFTGAEVGGIGSLSFNLLTVPEPATLSLIGFGALLVWRRKRSRD